MIEPLMDRGGPLPLHRPEEAAHLLGKSRSWAYEALAAGLLEYVVVGGSRRVPHDALVRFVERLRAEQAAA